MESEQSMAREHSDGSAIGMEFMVLFSFVGEVFYRCKNRETDVLGSP
jgi:hypothetical protein